MERAELKVESRTVHGKKVKRLRAESYVPGVVYGPDTEPKSIQIQERSLVNILQEAGTTSLIDLYVDGESKPFVVLAREIQRDALTGRFQHLDFYQVRLTEKVKTNPRLEVVGKSPLVESGGAVLVQILNQVEVECLPSDLVSSIPVDISVLQKLEDSVAIGDLPVPPGVTILADPSDTVVSVVPPRVALEEELEEAVPEEVVPEEAVAEGAAPTVAADEEEATPED